MRYSIHSHLRLRLYISSFLSDMHVLIKRSRLINVVIRAKEYIPKFLFSQVYLRQPVCSLHIPYVYISLFICHSLNFLCYMYIIYFYLFNFCTIIAPHLSHNP